MIARAVTAAEQARLDGVTAPLRRADVVRALANPRPWGPRHWGGMRPAIVAAHLGLGRITVRSPERPELANGWNVRNDLSVYAERLTKAGYTAAVDEDTGEITVTWPAPTTGGTP